jgi:hypothetical protein
LFSFQAPLLARPEKDALVILIWPSNGLQRILSTALSDAKGYFCLFERQVQFIPHRYVSTYKYTETEFLDINLTKDFSLFTLPSTGGF